MLIGIMSDAHDRIQGVKDALRIFSQKGVEMVLFAGDMIGSGNCYTFDGFAIPVKLVFGNNDGDRVGLEREFARVGGQYLGAVNDAFVSGAGVEASVVEYNRPMSQKEFNSLRDEMKTLQEKRTASFRTNKKRSGEPASTNVWTAADEKNSSRSPPSRSA